jgi:hypothetical protein
MSTALEEVIIDLVMHDADRGALVRDDKPGLIVLMLSQPAVAQLGGALLPLAKELGTPHWRFQRELSLRDSITRVLKDCDESPCKWLWFAFPYGKIHVVGAVFVGSICERVAAVCNAHRCPCSLDPKRAAQGYEIEKTVSRP